jgi:hypothetical protein
VGVDNRTRKSAAHPAICVSQNSQGEATLR